MDDVVCKGRAPLVSLDCGGSELHFIHPDDSASTFECFVQLLGYGCLSSRFIVYPVRWDLLDLSDDLLTDDGELVKETLVWSI